MVAASVPNDHEFIDGTDNMNFISHLKPIPVVDIILSL